jgi:hypothetical protein
MPLQKLQFRPGVNREGTTLANEGGWFDGDKIRFRSGYPEKIGGWAALSYNTFLGVCRSMWGWLTLKGYDLLGVGTNLKFYVENGGTYYDITPIKETNDNDPTGQITLACTNGSVLLTITDTNADSLQVNDFITIAGATTLGGNVTAAVLNQEYIIANVLSNTQYQIYLRNEATSINGVAFSVDTDTSFLTFPAGTTVTNGDKVVLLPGIAAPTGLSTNTVYYVVNTSVLTCQLSATLGGDPITITSAGIGLQAAYFLLTANATASNSTMAAVEIAYQINTGFPVFTVGTGWGAGPWPLYTSVALTNPFTATSAGITTVTVTTPSAHNLTDDDYVVFSSIASDVCGIVGSSSLFEIAFQVNVTGVDTFTISTVIGEAPGPVISYQTVSTGASGGAVTMRVPNPLPTTATNQRGWGTGFTTGIGQQLRLWSQANFGERLLFSPRSGPLYVWDPLTGTTPAFTSPGELVSGNNCPSVINQIMVSDSTRIVIAFGCNDYGGTQLDPLLIRWSAQESYTNWTPSLTNQAGSFRLSHGSEIICAFQTRQEIVVFTDAAIYSMQYLGPPLVWGFTLLADNLSIASPNAVATAAGVVYWMGTDKFYMYAGRVETLPCSVRQYVFSSINRQQEAQFFAGTNEGYSEVWWFYCSIEGMDGTGTIDNPNTTIDRYVIFNYLDRVWYYGKLERTAWLDSPLRQYPQAATTGNLIVLHEAAVDDGTTNPPSAIPAYVQSSDFDIGDGHNYGFVWRIIPDITFNGSNTSGISDERPTVTFTALPRQNPGSNYGAAPAPQVQSTQSYANGQSYTVQEFTEIVYTRVRGRQMSFLIESDQRGCQWQLGVPRMDVRPDGRR